MTTSATLDSFFDTPERDPNEKILKEILLLKNNAIINELLEGIPEIAVIINDKRQIVAFNSKALKAFVTDNYFDIVGKRTGEALNCIHCNDMAAGCGTSEFCRECGVGKAIRTTIGSGSAVEDECRITAVIGGKEVSFDFKISTHQIKLGISVYSILVLGDISGKKRREALERIFFHDVLNTASSLKSLSEILAEPMTDQSRNEIIESLAVSANQLIGEIQSQHQLQSAEDGTLEIDLQPLQLNNILQNVYDLYRNHEITKGKLISVNNLEDDIVFVSDSKLLIRSLSNLVKNALEASTENEEVAISGGFLKGEMAFNIHNPKVIPRNIQLQLFQRSFSTKQKTGRGIGLYSVKLIVEQYLNGKVTYVSNEKMGTLFSIRLPHKLPN